MGYNANKRGSSFCLVYRHAPDKDRYVPLKEWAALGFSKSMTLDEARARTQHLNAADKINRISERKNRIQARFDAEKQVLSAYLPERITAAFESRVLAQRWNRSTSPSKRHMSHWRAVQRLIKELALPPTEWGEQPELIYGYLEKIQFSLDYSSKLIRVINAYGYFYCKDTQQLYIPVPSLRDLDAVRIVSAYQEKIPGGMASERFTLDELHAAKLRGLQLDNFNWMYIALWFGLRPYEVDSLKNEKLTKFRVDKTGITIVSINQTKLKRLPPDKRWKHIPVIEKEQETALALIREGNFKRPLVKTIEAYLKPGVDVRGPRRSFTTLMHIVRGHPFPDVSAWMGHQSLDRTWRDYRDNQEVVYGNKAKG